MRNSCLLTVILAGLITLLPGCSNNPAQNRSGPHYQKLSLSTVEKQTFVSKEDLDTLFMQTQYVNADEKNPLFITISRRLSKDSQYELAKILLHHTDSLTSDEFEEKHLLLAQQHLNLRQFNQAYQSLKKLQGTQAIHSPRYQLLSAWYHYEKESYSSYLITLNDAINASQISNPQLAKSLILTTWKSIQLANPSQLSQLNAHPNTTIQGWTKLRDLIDPVDNPNVIQSPASTIQQLQEWRSLYPLHPGNQLFKAQPHTQNLASPPTVNKIGLMLPLTGKHQKASQLIQKALFSTYFATRPPHQTVSIYDSGQSSASYLYNIAKSNDNVQALIGPLTKIETEELVSQQSISIPTLVLNSSSVTQPLLTQYSLAPSQETHQLVTNMILSGYHHSLVLTDQSKSSETISSDFIAQFQNKGGIVADSVSLTENFNQGISSAMGTDNSKKRFQFAQSLSAEPIRAIMDKRQDIDSIFIAGELKNTRQLVPMLKYHYSGNLPIFSTSSINKSANPHKNQDLSNTVFFDAPLSPPLHKSPKRTDLPKKIMLQLQASDPSKFYEAFRFYGLGFDAYLITQTNYLWDTLEGYLIIGVNGALSKSHTGHINRSLTRMVFRNGVATTDTRYDPVREHWRELTHSHIQ